MKRPQRIHRILRLLSRWLIAVNVSRCPSTLGATLASLLACLFWTLPLHGAESPPPTLSPGDVVSMTLQELMKIEVPTVYGASRREEKTTNAPASITIVKRSDIASYGYRTLADILASTPGLYVTYDRSYSYLGVRGFNRGVDNNRVLILVNGHRLNNDLSDGGAIGTDFILDVDLIDRVEVIKGAGSVVYGNNAFFGVVNVVTKNGGDYPGYGAELSGAIASFDTYKGRVTFGHKFTNKVELLLSGSYYDSAGPRPLFVKGLGMASGGDDDQSKNAFGSIRYRDFTLEGAFITREKGDPTAPLGTVFNDPRTRGTDEREYVVLKYKHEFPEVLDEVRAQVYFDRYHFSGDFLYPDSGLNRDLRLGEWWGSEVQLSKRLWDDRLFLTLGGEYRDDFKQQRQNFYPAQPALGFFQLRRSTRNYGVYFQGDFQIVTNLLHFNAGVRYDQYGDFDPTANPRLALIYHPFEKATLKAIYGTAFRAPNFFELEDPLADLKPETITTYELVYEQGFGDHLRTSVSGFYNQIDDLIERQDDGSYVNKSGADADGVEVALEGTWAGGVRTRASYTYQETKDRLTDQVLTDSPRHLGKLSLTVPLIKERLSAGLEVQFTSKRRTMLTVYNPDPLVGGLITSRGADAAGFGIVNATLFSQNLVKNLDLSASVYNLLDRKYDDPATPSHIGQDLIQQNGRTFRVKLTYRF